jgi:hypothetical protein
MLVCRSERERDVFGLDVCSRFTSSSLIPPRHRASNRLFPGKQNPNLSLDCELADLLKSERQPLS